MDSPTQEEREVEMEKLARAISDELDVALIEAGLVEVSKCVNYDRLDETSRTAIQKAAARLYMTLVYDTANGMVRVIRPNDSYLHHIAEVPKGVK
jgi:NH3-dependent NAD+ synthetase